MGLSFFGPLVSIKVHDDCDKRRMILWLILPRTPLWGSTFSFSLEGVHFNVCSWELFLVIEPNSQRSPETNQYFSKARFILFSPLSSPSWEVILNELIPKMCMCWTKITSILFITRCPTGDTNEELPSWKKMGQNLNNPNGMHTIKVRFLPKIHML